MKQFLIRDNFVEKEYDYLAYIEWINIYNTRKQNSIKNIVFKPKKRKNKR